MVNEDMVTERKNCMDKKKFLYETHMHTSETSFCSTTKAKEHVRIYHDRGYAGIIITDHLSTRNFRRSKFKKGKSLRSWEEKVKFLLKGYEKAKEEGDKIGLDVFLGWEFYANGSEFLTYGLGKEFLLNHKDLDKMLIDEYSKLVRENGGYLAQAHPYREKEGMEVPVDQNLIDGVEIYNASRTHKGKENAKAIVFAREHNLPVQAGTDAHKPNLKLYSGVMLDHRAKDIKDIIQSLKEKSAKPILQPLEEVLWKGNLEDARKYTETPKVSDCLVKIFYDCKHAKEIAEELCDYIDEHTDFDCICNHWDNFGNIQKTGKLTKTIIIGHHTDTKKKIEKKTLIQHQKHGTQYGYNQKECVMIASKSWLKKNKKEQARLFDDFNEVFDDDPETLHLRKVQFMYIVNEFLQNHLEDFLKG